MNRNGRTLTAAERSTGPEAPHRTTPHVFTRPDGNWWLVGKIAGRRLDHREYLQGRKSWDRFFDTVHASDGGTVQWYTAKALA